MTTFTEFFVTPCAVAPPLSLPAAQGLTQNGPDPSSANDVRPFSLQVSCVNAVFEPMPSPFGCGPTPPPVNDGGDADQASEMLRTPSRPTLTTTATTRAARRDLIIPPVSSRASPRFDALDLASVPASKSFTRRAARLARPATDIGPFPRQPGAPRTLPPCTHDSRRCEVVPF